MKHTDYTGIVPAQYTGREIEAASSAVLKTENEAITFYDIVKERLLHVNNWHRVAGILSAKFQLVNATGAPVDRNVQQGDHFRIDIPGPGSPEGDGYDWVWVEEVKEVSEANIQSIGIRVRPAPNPLGGKHETAHFYSHEATSNFIVTRENSTVIARIIDRNIKPNDHASSLIDKIRDSAVGISAIGMFSKVQWQGLSNGLVKNDD